MAGRQGRNQSREKPMNGSSADGDVGELPLSDDAQRLLAEARDESERLRHTYIGIEHLLLALSRRTGTPDTAPFVPLGLDGEQVRGTIASVVMAGRDSDGLPSGAERPLTTRTKSVLALAAENAGALGQPEVGTHHVLLGIVLERKGIGAEILWRHGITVEAVEAFVQQLG
jgi:ATP-dependent Clp protease ATP-binding subunit ClpC